VRKKRIAHKGMNLAGMVGDDAGGETAAATGADGQRRAKQT